MSKTFNGSVTVDQAVIAADTRSLPIGRITVGERHRRDLGDIAALAKSIDEIGLLHPVPVTSDGHLIAGERRLRAVEMLGWKTVPCTLIPINLDQIVRGEFAENTCRKNFTWSEAVGIKRALEPLEKAKAKERQGTRTDKHLEKFSTSSSGRALDKVAVVVGKHRTTLAKAEAIVDAAEAEPAKYSYLVEEMDQTGRVDGAYRQLKSRQQDEAGHAKPPRSKPNEQWADLRAAFEHLTSLPCPHDAAHAVAKLAKVGEIIDRRLPSVVQWLREFQDVWNPMRGIGPENGAEPSIGELCARIEELENENAELRKLKVTQGAAEIATADTVTYGDPGPIPGSLLRKPEAASASDGKAR